MKLQPLLFGILLVSASGCAHTEPRQAESDMSGKPYVLAAGRCLAAAEQFTVRVRMDKDEVIDNQVIVGPTERIISLRRPDRLAVRLVHPRGYRQTWYDGSRIVCLEAGRGAYASVPARGSVDDMFVSLRRDNHYVRPLAALCSSDPGRSLCEKARRVTYLGKQDLSGRPCNVVRIEREDAIFELWIADAAQPLLLQAAVRQADNSEPPRFARFENWNLRARLADVEFRPQLPQGAYQIELYDLTGMP